MEKRGASVFALALPPGGPHFGDGTRGGGIADRSVFSSTPRAPAFQRGRTVGHGPAGGFARDAGRVHSAFGGTLEDLCRACPVHLRRGTRAILAVRGIRDRRGAGQTRRASAKPPAVRAKSDDP